MLEAKRTIKYEKGFTFLELLLVLSIVMILTAVILPFSEKRLQKISEEDALKQFIATVHETQLYAITHRQRVVLFFGENGGIYKVKGDDVIDVLNGQFPEGMHLVKYSNFRKLNFTETGYLLETGSMIFDTKSKGKIKITFQFERGRMLVYE